MARNSGGTYTRLTPPGPGGYVAGTVIKPSEVNGELNDFKNEITDSVSRSGKGAALANLPMGGFKHTGAAAATVGGEYIEFAQFNSAQLLKANLAGGAPFTGNVSTTGSLTAQGAIVGASTTIAGIANLGSIEVNAINTGNRFANIDLHGDDTWTDYSFRIARDAAGLNANSLLFHRGTGSLILAAQEAGSIVMQTNSVTRMTVTSGGDVGFTGAIASPQVNAINTAKAFVVFNDAPTILQSSNGAITVTKTAAGKFIVDNLPGMANAWYSVQVTQDLNNLDFTIYNRSAGYFYIDFFARGGGFTNPNVVSITIHGG